MELKLARLLARPEDVDLKAVQGIKEDHGPFGPTAPQDETGRPAKGISQETLELIEKDILGLAMMGYFLPYQAKWLADRSRLKAWPKSPAASGLHLRADAMSRQRADRGGGPGRRQAWTCGSARPIPIGHGRRNTSATRPIGPRCFHVVAQDLEEETITVVIDDEKQGHQGPSGDLQPRATG